MRDIPTDTKAILENPESWVDKYGDLLYRYALSRIQNPSTAEDLVQETFLAALRARDRFAGNSTTRTWLVGILRHKIYDHLRHICRERPMGVARVCDTRDQDAWDSSMLWLHQMAAECASPSRR